MPSGGRIILALGAFIAASGLAKAADWTPPHASIDAPPSAPAEFNGWYLRGDVGAAMPAGPISLAVNPSPLTGLPPDAFERFYNITSSASPLVDVGVGYQVNPWLRFDVTAEYRGGSDFQALEQIAAPSLSLQEANWYRGTVSSFIGMANAYVDVGTWQGVTPYLGAGVGVAQNRLTGVSNPGFLYPPGAPIGGNMADGAANNLAWALMAGLDFRVTSNLRLELGYRYLDYGRLKSGVASCFNGTGAAGGINPASCGGSFTGQTNRLAAQDVRLGMRWMFNDAPSAVQSIAFNR